MTATKSIEIEPGVWYEAARNRYRVRLYHKGRVVHLSYHQTEPEALDMLDKARHIQHEVRETYQEPEPIPPTLENLLRVVNMA